MPMIGNIFAAKGDELDMAVTLLGVAKLRQNLGRVIMVDGHVGVSQNCGPHKTAERYRPSPSILVVFHTFLSVTPMTHTF